MTSDNGGVAELKFRDPARARALADALARVVEEIGATPVSVMHVCGSHEQAIARFGLRATLPRRSTSSWAPAARSASPTCPRSTKASRWRGRACASRPTATCCGCRARRCRWPTRRRRARGRRRLQRRAGASSWPGEIDEPLVFFATGFETTAVATAAAVLRDPPSELLRPVGAQVHPAGDGNRRRDAGHARRRVPRRRSRGDDHRLGRVRARSSSGTSMPVVVAGFEPLDILAGLVKLAELIRDGAAVGREHVSALRDEERATVRAQEQLWRVFRPIGGRWRGIAHVPNGNLRLRDEWAHLDAREQFDIDLHALWDLRAVRRSSQECVCGDIMAGIKSPTDCALFGTRVRAALAGRRVHGEQRGHLQDLAPVRRTSRLVRRLRWRVCAR